MISKNLCLLTVFFFFYFKSCSEIEYDHFIKDFIEKTFDKDFKFIRIENLEEKTIKFTFEDKEIIEKAKTLFAEENFSKKLDKMIELGKKALKKKSSAPKDNDACLKKFFKKIPYDDDEYSKKQYLESLQDAFKFFENRSIENSLNFEIYNYFSKDFYDASSNFFQHLCDVIYLLEEIDNLILRKREDCSIIQDHEDFKVTIKEIFDHMENAMMACINYFKYMLDYRSTILELLEKTEIALKKKHEEFSQMSEEEIEKRYKEESKKFVGYGMLGEARKALKDLRDCNKQRWKDLYRCFDSFEKFLKVLEEKNQQVKTKNLNKECIIT